MLLLDSDVVIDLLRRFPPAVDWFRGLPQDKPAIPGPVLLELMEGCGSRREMRLLKERMTRFSVVWPTVSDFEHAAAALEVGRLSHGLRAMDALIGSCAVGLGLPLDTFNVKHFAAVPGLRTVQPYRR